MNGIMKQTRMNGYAAYEINHEINHRQMNTAEQEMSEEIGAKCSGFSMMAMAGALLMCVGIVLYALLTV